MIIKTLAACLAALSFAALADGVSVFIPPTKTALTPADVKQLAQEHYTKSVLVELNKFALDSNVLSADIDGKTYRFIGQKATDLNQVDSWIGRDGENTAILTRGASGIHGQFELRTHTLFLVHLTSGGYVLAEYVAPVHKFTRRPAASGVE